MRVEDRTIALRKKDPEAARQVVLTGEGKKIMDAIRAQVRQMQQEERDLLVARERQSDQSYLVIILTRFFTLVLGVGMVGATYDVAAASSRGASTGREIAGPAGGNRRDFRRCHPLQGPRRHHPDLERGGRTPIGLPRGGGDRPADHATAAAGASPGGRANPGAFAQAASLWSIWRRCA